MSAMKKYVTILMAPVPLAVFTILLLPTLAPHTPPLWTTAPIAEAFAGESSQDQQNQIQGQTRDTATFFARALLLLRRLKGIQAEKVQQLEKDDTDWIKVFELNIEAAQVITQLEKTAKHYGIPPYVGRMESLLKSTAHFQTPASSGHDDIRTCLRPS
jgi:hypothetical protein